MAQEFSSEFLDSISTKSRVLRKFFNESVFSNIQLHYLGISVLEVSTHSTCKLDFLYFC